MSLIKRFAGLWLMCVVLLLSLSAAPALAAGDSLDDVVPDPVLRALINQTLSTEEAPRGGADPISAEDMAKLTGSDAAAIDAAEDDAVFALKGLCSDNLPITGQDPVTLNPTHGITSLEGMQYAVNLKSLDLSENSIADLSPLSGLTNLTYLELDRNFISDLTPLAGLTSLEHLNLYNNLITDISPLAGLAKVNWLDLHYANRGAAHLPIGPLASMTALQYISIESNDLVNEDLTALSGLQNLNYIKLNANHITDLTPIAGYVEKVMAGEPCRIEVNNQSLPGWQTALVEAPPAGGDVTLAVPEVKGIDALLGEPGDWTISPAAMADLAQAVPGVSASFAGEGLDFSQAVFTFSDRVFGTSLAVSEELCLTFAVSAFDMSTFEEYTPFIYTLYLPVELRQEAAYQAQLTAPDAGIFATIDTAGGNTASGFFTGAIVTAAGEPVALEEILSIRFCVAGKSYESPLSGVTATDISVNGDSFSFRVAVTEDTPFSGAQAVTPVIEYRRAGSDAVETISRDILSFYLYAGDAQALQVPSTVPFDLATLANGQVVSLPVSFSLPGCTLSLINITLQDAARKTLCTGAAQEDGSYVFTPAMDTLDQISCFHLTGANPNGTDWFDLYPAASVELVCSSAALAPALQAQPVTAGYYAMPVIRANGVPVALDGVTMASSTPSVLAVVNGQLLGLSAGTATLTLTGLTLPVTTGGSTYDRVRFTAPLSVAVTVQPLVVLPGTGSSTTPNPDPQSGTEPAPLPFADVAETAWYYDAVSYVAEQGLMTGVSDASFDPTGTLTRSMVTQILYNREGRPALSGETATAFADVPTTSWYAACVQWAWEQELVAGFDDDTFGPGDAVTREQLAVILYRYALRTGLAAGSEGASLDRFTDGGDASSWARQALGWAVEQGILSGRPNGTLDPQGTASRAEAAAMFQRLCLLLEPIR